MLTVICMLLVATIFVLLLAVRHIKITTAAVIAAAKAEIKDDIAKLRAPYSRGP